MGFTVVCHGCGHVLYQGIDIIPFYKLRSQLEGKCPSCERKLAIRPVTVKLKGVNFEKFNNAKMSQFRTH